MVLSILMAQKLSVVIVSGCCFGRRPGGFVKCTRDIRCWLYVFVTEPTNIKTTYVSSDTLLIDPSEAKYADLTGFECQEVRTSILFLGAMLGRFKCKDSFAWRV